MRTKPRRQIAFVGLLGINPVAFAQSIHYCMVVRSLSGLWSFIAI
ncbi:MAG: hypothetical protein K0Q73_1996 [Paenibacillus sp.]|nr:hypothetical protein [Paenibacillus sp.]